jgi:dipeptidase
MDKTTLSKHRWIYKMYINGNNEVHVERYKVIYINASYVYYISGGEDMLNYMSLSSVFNNLEEFISEGNIERFLSSAYWTVFFWESVGQFDYESLRRKAEKQNIEKKVAQTQEKIKSLQKEQKALQKEINVLIAKGASL